MTEFSPDPTGTTEKEGGDETTLIAIPQTLVAELTYGACCATAERMPTC